MGERADAQTTNRESESPLVLTHVALRTALLATLTRMIQFPRGAAHEREQIVDDLDGVLYLCEAHAATEEHVLAAVIDRIRPNAYEDLRKVHRAEELAIDELRAACASWLESEGRAADGALLALFQRAAAFAAWLIGHFEAEEAEISSLTRTALTQRELLATYEELAAASGPEERVSYSRIAYTDPESTTNFRHAPLLSRDDVVSTLAELFSRLTQSERRSFEGAITLRFGDA